MAVVAALSSSQVRADEVQRDTIRGVRQEIESIRSEIHKAEPYPGGQRWQERLNALPAKLARSAGGDPQRFRWFAHAIANFRDRSKEDSLHILNDLHRRLQLLEDSLRQDQQTDAATGEKRSPEDIKSLLRGSEGRKVERNQSRRRVEEDRPEIRREEPKGNEPENNARRAGGGRAAPVSVSSGKSGGFSSLGWVLLGGVALAVVVVSLYLYFSSPRKPKPEKSAAPTAGQSPDNDAQRVLEDSPAALWRQAETLAGEGRYRDAVRALYLSVLALLHRQQLIRFEPTRTNGEYVRQVRLSEKAPPELHEPLHQLTAHFEKVWYGERPCESSDYGSCRAVAQEVQQFTAAT